MTRAPPGGPTCTTWASLTLSPALALTPTLPLTPALTLPLPLSRYGLGCFQVKPLASLYWGSHQRFFKELCMSFKVDDAAPTLTPHPSPLALAASPTTTPTVTPAPTRTPALSPALDPSVTR